ncbi:hypothetical protein DFH28DRAFT_1082168 [Melampsora americana]|nr:hypothetical protein DFH28DRAFT_1082168 [Melampsora americana]
MLKSTRKKAAEGALGLLTGPSHQAANAQPAEQEQPQGPDRYRAFQRPDEFEADNNPPNPTPANLNEYYKGITYQEQTLRKEAAWQLVIPKLFAAFMPCRNDMYQWGHPTLWSHDWNQPCCCRKWKKVKFFVDAIDLTVRLIRMGFIGGTPTQPCTVFSFQMSHLQRTLWKYSSVRLTPFVEALDKFLDAYCHKLFSAAFNAYREMISLEDELTSNCPSCFGPTVAGAREDKPNHYICLDANFQQCPHLSVSDLWQGKTGKTKMASPAQQPNQPNPNQQGNDLL